MEENYGFTFTYSSPTQEDEEWLTLEPKEQAQFLVDRQLESIEKVLKQWAQDTRGISRQSQSSKKKHRLRMNKFSTRYRNKRK